MSARIIGIAACIAAAAGGAGLFMTIDRRTQISDNMGDARPRSSAVTPASEQENYADTADGGFVPLETVLTASDKETGQIVVREAPDASADTAWLDMLEDGREVSVRGYTLSSDGSVWFEISYNDSGGTGWVMGNNLRPASIAMLDASIFSAPELDTWRESFTLLQPAEQELIDARPMTLNGSLWCHPDTASSVIERLSSAEVTAEAHTLDSRGEHEWYFVTLTSADGVYYEGWALAEELS